MQHAVIPVGFWFSPTLFPTLPVPVPGASDNSDLVAAMAQVERYLSKKFPKSMSQDECGKGEGWIAYRGLSMCRICQQRNGFQEFYAAGYCWPEGLSHYLVHHGLELEAYPGLAEFRKALMEFAVALPTLPAAPAPKKRK